MTKGIFPICVTFLLLSFIGVQCPHFVIGQNESELVIKNNTWSSVRDNISITLTMLPQIPHVDEITRLMFDARDISNSTVVENLNARLTMTDHDGRLYKFENTTFSFDNGQFFTDYIFPDDGEHRVLIQLYQNTTPFSVGSI